LESEIRMVKKQRNLGAICLLILLSSVVCVLITPSVHAAKLSSSERGLGVLRDFFGLDLEKYDIVKEENSLSEPFLGNAAYESVFFTLTSGDSKLRVVFTFVDNNLRNIYVFENKGVPLLKGAIKSSTVVGNAQSFLGAYEQYSSKPLFGDLKTTLNDVTTNKNYTKTVGNKIVEGIFYENNEAMFMWHYTTKDSTIPRTAVVALGFKDGDLVSFSDTWSIYGINERIKLLGDSKPNDVENSWIIQSFEETTVLSMLIMYFVVILLVTTSSMFVVGLFFRRCLNRGLFKRFSVKAGGLFLGLLLVLTIFLPLAGYANASSAGVIWGSRSSGAQNIEGYHSWRKTNAEISKQEYVSSFIASKCLTAANGYAGFANIWSNKSGVLSQAQSLNSKYDNVAVFNWDHGVGGYPGRLSSYLVPDDELHYMFEDDFGTFVGVPSDYKVDWSHGVYDIDIYEIFTAGKVHFAFINTCLSANIDLFGQGHSPSGYPLGMPYAFTHRLVGHGNNATLMSYDGYNYPDAFPQCYIGFPFGSAALDQYIAYHNNEQPWYEWVVYFCYMAFNFDVSVNDALDWACSMQWGCSSFGISPLQGEGFTAIWPIWDDTHKVFNETGPNAQGPHSTLAVYGNGNIHLKNFQAEHMITYPCVSSPSVGNVDTVINFSAYAVDSHGHNIRYIFDWEDGTPQTITEYTVAGVPVNVSHSWNTVGIYEVTVRAQCEDGTCTEWSKPYIITIGGYGLLITITIVGLILCIIMLLIILWRHAKKRVRTTNS